MTPEKIALGSQLFNDKRFSSTGEVSLRDCHDPAKAFTDSPLKTSEGISKLTGTRNAPTSSTRRTSPTSSGRPLADLEEPSQHPFINPVEMGLADHEPILKIVRSDPTYVDMFRKSFGVEPPRSRCST